MLPPPRHQHSIDPDDLVQQMEDDPLSNFAWRVITTTTNTLTTLLASIQRMSGRSVHCMEAL